MTTENSNQKKRGQRILSLASQIGWTAWFCQSVSVQPFWWEVAYIGIICIFLRTNDSSIYLLFNNYDILFSEGLSKSFKNSAESCPNFNWVECILPIVFIESIHSKCKALIHVCTNYSSTISLTYSCILSQQHAILMTDTL